MLFAHLKRILKLDRLRLSGPNGARDEFHLAATAQTSEARQADPDAGTQAGIAGTNHRKFRLIVYRFKTSAEITPAFSTESPDSGLLMPSTADHRQ
ncbi:transposon-related protein (plasmid) [Sinorhizobium fredii HH103]|uniref:Transposon-related protein n=1 Tax=Sinorhizobium fredii (strain HH103) TaxID=1117943 RepID=G9AF73_SINF1|nr:transposon-related protein [Sinorhizobium fredii HH103]